jgi:hypothetical protein
MLPLVDMFRNREIELEVTLQDINTVLETFKLSTLEYV